MPPGPLSCGPDYQHLGTLHLGDDNYDGRRTLLSIKPGLQNNFLKRHSIHVDKDTYLHIHVHRKTCSCKEASNLKSCDHDPDTPLLLVKLEKCQSP